MYNHNIDSKRTEHDKWGEGKKLQKIKFEKIHQKKWGGGCNRNIFIPKYTSEKTQKILHFTQEFIGLHRNLD